VSKKQRKLPREMKAMSKTAQRRAVAGPTRASKGKYGAGKPHAVSQLSSWRSNLHAYQEKSSIRFHSEEDMDAFIDLIWIEADLKGMPHIPVGENTIIIPRAAENIVSRKLSGKYCVNIGSVLDPQDLPADEFAKLQQERDTI